MPNLSKVVVKQLEKLLTKDGWLERWIANNSLVGNSVFFEEEHFPWSKDLEANWMVIRKELDQVLERVDDLPNFQDISKRQSRIANDNRWKTYFFYAFGFKATKNCERCPETTKLLEQIPGMKVAFFSILAPGKHIPKHRGKLKTFIRYHLGLIVPEPKENCKIQVADEIKYWEEGKSLIFDDTFYHEVWNDTDGYRVVLFLDIARPLKFPVNVISSLANKFITATPIVKDAKASHKAWEDKFEKKTKSEELVS